jgi:predicted Zn-dependent protease
LQAAPEMAQQYGGLEQDPQAQAIVDAVGQHLVVNSIASQTTYPFEFHLLADDQTVNAFALPGGQIFITDALFDRLESEGQLAGVLAHEIVHVIARHGAQRIANQQLTEGLTGALVLATYDPNDPRTQQTAQVALMIGQVVNMKFGREDELQSDTLGVRIMSEAGYDPRSMIGVMEILEAASGGAAPPEFFSTHPDPGNRLLVIEQAIEEQYPDGVPDDLVP